MMSFKGKLVNNIRAVIMCVCEIQVQKYISPNLIQVAMFVTVFTYSNYQSNPLSLQPIEDQGLPTSCLAFAYSQTEVKIV